MKQVTLLYVFPILDYRLKGIYFCSQTAVSIYGGAERTEVFWKRMGFTITGYDMEKELS